MNNAGSQANNVRPYTFVQFVGDGEIYLFTVTHR